MNSDLFSLLVRCTDLQRNLAYIIKNSAYKESAAAVAVDHIKDMNLAIESTLRVLEEVLREQMKTA